MNNINYNYENEEEPKSGFRTVFLICAIGVLAIALVIAVAFLLDTGIKEQKYSLAIASGNNYYNMGDYQNAVIEYQLAVSIDKKKSMGYKNLSSAYIGMGDYASAQNVLIMGLTLIDDPELQERLELLKTLENAKFGTVQTHLLTEDEIAEYSADATMEDSYLDMIASYTYTDYYRDYGYVDGTVSVNGQIMFTYDGIGMEALYYDLDNEKVLDNSGNMPVANSKPCSVRFRSIARLFSGGGENFAVSADKLRELLGGNVEFSYDNVNGRYIVSAQYKHCNICMETDENGNIVSPYVWNEFKPLNRGSVITDGEVDGSVSGYIQDATTGKGMKAALKIRKRGMKTGNTVAETVSANDGSYVFEGLAGLYTMEVSASGYITEYMDVEIVKNQTKTGKNVILSPVVAAGQLRIVLSWGSYPSDLDSHAEGKSSSGSSFHIWFRNKSQNKVGILDVDDTNGYGPETITITDAGSSFNYYVYDFTQSGNIASSGATVKVYLPDKSVKTFNVPAGEGNTWKVFKYEDGQITDINTIS